MSYPFSLKKYFLSVKWKLAKKKKTDMSRIKGVVKKNTVWKMIKKKGCFLLQKKNICWIKDDRDSVTRPKVEIWKNKKSDLD